MSKLQSTLALLFFDIFLEEKKLDNTISQLLNKNKFKEKQKTVLNKNIFDTQFLDIEDSYIYQPFGSQQSPDFIIIENKKVFFLESKTSKNSYKPMLNSHIINPTFIYVFSFNNVTFPIKGDKLTSYELYEYINYLFCYKRTKKYDINGVYVDFNRMMLDNKMNKNTFFGKNNPCIENLLFKDLDINTTYTNLKYTNLTNNDLKNYLSLNTEYSFKLKDIIKKEIEEINYLIN